MTTVETQTDRATRAECPKCRNRDGIKDGGLSMRGRRAYDVMHDTYGLIRCPKCGHAASYAAFHKQT